MVEFLVEPLLEVFGILLYALGAGALTVIGAFAEQAGVQSLTAGDSTLGLWFVVIGAVALYAGYLLTTDKLLPQVRALSW